MSPRQAGRSGTRSGTDGPVPSWIRRMFNSPITSEEACPPTYNRALTCNSCATQTGTGGSDMTGKWRPFLLAAVLSIMWYGTVGLVDRGLMIRQESALSTPCLRDLPEGTIHNPENYPPVTARYVFLPLGLYCSYTMTDGSGLESFHPRYVQTIVGGLPIVLTVIFKARSRRQSSKTTEAK
jgi:hypothetical protein